PRLDRRPGPLPRQPAPAPSRWPRSRGPAMTFLSPWWLLLLVPVALLAIAYLVQHRRRSRYAVRFASLPMLARLAPSRPGWRRHAPAAFMLCAFALLALAAARPEMEVRVPRENATVVVTV